MEDEKPSGAIGWAMLVVLPALGYVFWNVFNFLVGA